MVHRRNPSNTFDVVCKSSGEGAIEPPRIVAWTWPDS